MMTPIGRFSFGEFVSASRRRLASRFVAPLCGLVIALASVVPAPAQTAATGTLTGRVQNVDSGSYLNNARIRVLGTTRETFTNEFGEYRLTGLPAGEVRLDVFYTGLASRQLAVTVPAGGTVTQDVDMMADEANRVIKLSQFVVQSQREMDAAAIAINEQRFAAARKDVVSTDAFGEINQGNIGEFVKFLPGISLDVKDGNTPSGIMVRGFDPNYTNVTMDGGQMASTLIANTQTSSRQFVLEGMNINNIARIEVVKLPTPDMSANLLGGAVNFISKSAFERSRPETRLSVYLSANEKDISLKKSPGPFTTDTYKTLPSFDFQYVNPFSKRFGVVVTAQHTSQFYLQNKASMGHKFTSGGATLTNPYTTNLNTSVAPNRSDRTGGGITFDMKPWDHSVIKLNVQVSAQKQQNTSRSLNYSIGGATPVSWDEHNTAGGYVMNTNGTVKTGGSVGMGTSGQERHALTRSIAGSWDFEKNDWKIETGFNYSNSNNRTRDMAKGFFRNINVALPGVRNVNLVNFDPSTGYVGNVDVFGADGSPIDEHKLSNWRLIQSSNASEPANNVDDVKQARAFVTRHLTLWNTPIAIKAGGDIIDSKRDQEYATIAYTYVGPDGVNNSADDSLGNYVSEAYRGVTPGFGVGAPEWPDSFAIYRDFLAHPNWWTQTSKQLGDGVKNIAVRSPWLHETITSGFIMADAKLFKGKLRLVGGIRYELTEDEGQGYLQDPTLTYLKDSAGNIVYTTNSNGTRSPVIRPDLVKDGPEYNALMYQKRAYYNSRDYSYYHPSAAATYSITENLLLRAAFAKTIGRPNISDIVPTLYVSENLNFGVPESGSSSSVPGWISGANTGLKPWTAKNYDYSLEYYLPKGGMVMFNVYRKDIKNFFKNIDEIADEALLERLGIGSEALGYTYSHKINVADARIQGWEFNLDFPLSNLTEYGSLLDGIGRSWLRHFSLRYNMTHLDLSGSRIGPSDWKRYIPRSRNYGLQWRFPKFSGSVLVNWRGRMLRDDADQFPGANEYIRSRYQVDASAEYQITKRYSAFFAVRNLFNAVSEWEVAGPGVPAWSTLTNIEDYGAQYSLGVRAVF